jgi:hypothetical protein
MAESITYKVSVSPFYSQVSTTKKEGEYDNEVILSTANYNAIAKLFNEIKAGTDVSSVVTAINAL